ncbi:MAG: transglutaminase domain-containing protein [Myxococcota bacterium]
MLSALILAITLPLPASPPTTGEAPAEPLALRLAQGQPQSLPTLARQLRSIADETERARAVHDFVALWLEYRAGDGSPQEPATVLARRTGNCDGYARLFEALARAAGLEVKTITGLARDLQDRPQPHAWNVIRLGGAWRFVDVTFDDPTVVGESNGPALRSDYFLTSPDVAILDHLPADRRWLLGAAPLTRGQFLAQGPERATTRGRGLRLGATRREDEVLVVPIGNETRRHLLVRIDGEPCAPVSDAPELEVRCAAKAGQPHRLELFTHSAPTGLFLSVTEWTTP